MRFNENWYSQAGQDKWVAGIFKNKRNGYFLDIGAGDGWGDSNTWHFEEKLGWTGINVECGIKDFLACQELRKKSINTSVAIWSYSGNLSFDLSSHTVKDEGFGIPVAAITFEELFQKYNVPKLIDYVSLDIEGSELEALKGWPWETHKAIAWTIEHNLYRDRTGKMKNEIHDYMLKSGHVRVVENVACKDSQWGAFEDWYLHKDYVHLNDDIDLSFAVIGE